MHALRTIAAAAAAATVVVVVVVVAIVCLEANLAHSAEQGVDSQEVLDYLNRTRNLFADHI
jgi:hypothetical protein